MLVPKCFLLLVVAGRPINPYAECDFNKRMCRSPGVTQSQNIVSKMKGTLNSFILAAGWRHEVRGTVQADPGNRRPDASCDGPVSDPTGVGGRPA